MIMPRDLKDPEIPVWVIVSGPWNLPDELSWLRTSERNRYKKDVEHVGRRIRQDIYSDVKEIMNAGWGLITGGAPGADEAAAKAGIKYGDANQVLVITPVPLENLCNHMDSPVIGREHAERMHQLLYFDVPENRIYDRTRFKIPRELSYQDRNKREVAEGDVLLAYHLDGTDGTGHTINEGRGAGILVYVKRYVADNPGWTSRFKANSYNVPNIYAGWKNRMRGIKNIERKKAVRLN
jgi:hypothetical protein